jgi:hypothetical protein
VTSNRCKHSGLGSLDELPELLEPEFEPELLELLEPEFEPELLELLEPVGGHPGGV